MATCEFCADELPAGVRFCPSCGASAGGGTGCPHCHAANALMAVHCNQCGALLTDDVMTTLTIPAPAVGFTNEASRPAEPAALPEWLFLEDEAPAPAAGPMPAVAHGAIPQALLPTPEADIPANEDLAAALRDLSRADEPAPRPHEEPSTTLSSDLAEALRDLPLDLLAPREEPLVPPPSAHDLDKALRELLDQPAPAPEPPPPPRLEEEGEFYRWLQQAMRDAPPEGEAPEGEGGRGKGEG